MLVLIERGFNCYLGEINNSRIDPAAFRCCIPKYLAVQNLKQREEKTKPP
jgi:hypothetical protein